MAEHKALVRLKLSMLNVKHSHEANYILSTSFAIVYISLWQWGQSRVTLQELHLNSKQNNYVCLQPLP
jgi:hypothetical protein